MVLVKKGDKNALELADLFCREVRRLEGDLVQPVVPTAEQVEEAIRKLA